MTTYYEETRKLNDLIDVNSRPVTALALKMGMEKEEIFAQLADAYEEALEKGIVEHDGEGIHFETYFADITLVQNMDFTSMYDRYLRFELKSFNYEVYNAIEEPKENVFGAAFQKLGITFEEESAQVEETDKVEPLEETLINNAADGIVISAEEEAFDAKAGSVRFPENLYDHVTLWRSNLMRLHRFMTDADGEPSNEVIEQLNNDYVKAKESGELEPYNDNYNFWTSFETFFGARICVAIKPIPNEDDPDAWALNYVGYRCKKAPFDVYAALEEFAGVSKSFYLRELADLAKKEKWCFGEENEKLNILKNYIAYTFHKVQKEGKVCVNKNEDFAAFHTGLATEDYEDIYMCFVKSGAENGPKWRYAGVCTDNSGRYFKHLVGSFYPLPKPAQYIMCKEDVLYDDGKELYLDVKHIITDRLHRLPLEFLKSCAVGNQEVLVLLDRFNVNSAVDQEELYEELRTMIKNSSILYETIKMRLQMAVNKSVKALRWNYRMAIPCYYAKADVMSLLLPVDFIGTGEPQVALVVQMMESGNYIGHTLLNMEMAYINARLIGSQESSWLRA